MANGYHKKGGKMKDLIFTIEPETRKVTANKNFIGVSGENLQGNIIAGFKDNQFIDGTGYFEVIINENRYFLQMEKNAEAKTYSLPITNSLLQQSGALICQFVINQANDAKFKSQKFNIPVLTAINATQSVPEEYQDWVDQVNEAIGEIDGMQEDISDIQDELQDHEESIENLTSEVQAIQGRGGYLKPYDFGVLYDLEDPDATPEQKQATQDALTNYALSLITNIQSASEIFDGTRVTNLYNNHTWILNNTPDTTPAVFEWVDLGQSIVSTATNNTQGVVQGSADNMKVKVNADGTMEVNLTFDNTPTANSDNPVKSGGVYSALGDKQDTIQYSTMPTASIDNVGQIVQFTGTTGTYTKGHFYICVEDNGSYDWEEILYGTPNAVTINTNQTITGEKSFDNNLKVINSSIQNSHPFELANEGQRTVLKVNNTELLRFVGQYGTAVSVALNPLNNNTTDLGKQGNLWKDLYLAGKIALDNYVINKDNFGQLQIGNANTTSIQFDGSTVRAQNIVPMGNNQKDLGSSSLKWKDLYLAGNITDGTNSVSVAQLLMGGVFKALTLTSTTLTADQVTTLQNYNVVLESDITLSSGTTLHAQTILTRPFVYSNTLRGLYIDNSKIGTYLIDTNTNVLGQGAQDIVINGIAQINSKAIPSYPSDNTKTYILEYVNGTITWVENNIPTAMTNAEIDTIMDAILI